MNISQMMRGGEYFCGAIIIAKNEEGRFEIIDGQQRLTTFIILSCVIRDCYRDRLKKNATQTINNSIEDADDKEKLRLEILSKTQEKKEKKAGAKILSQPDKRNDFKQYIIKRVDFDKNNTYCKSANYIKDSLEMIESEYKKEDETFNIDDFVNYFFTKIKLVVIQCPSAIDSIQIFNVINDSGLKLSFVDIIKSTMIHKLRDDKKSRESFVTEWQKLMDFLENNKINSEYFFGIFAYYRLGRQAKRNTGAALLEDALGKKFFKKQVQDPKLIGAWIGEVNQVAQCYAEILKENDRYINLCKYLLHKIHWQSLLTIAYMHKYENLDSLKKYLLAWYYQNWIAGNTASTIQFSSYKIATIIKNNENIDRIKSIIKNNISDYSMDKEYKENIVKSNIGNIKKNKSLPWCKPILILLEHFSTNNKSPGFMPLNTNSKKQEITLEHILPRSPSAKSSEQFSSKERDELLGSLGNLTLLYGEENSKASNKDFNNKRAVYLHSYFHITKDLASEYKEWNPNNLRKRQDAMRQKIDEILDLFNDENTDKEELF